MTATYPGDKAFQSFLNQYDCPTPLPVIKMRILGAIASPDIALGPVAVIASLWPTGGDPRLEKQDEAAAFFDTFLTLWAEMLRCRDGEAKPSLPKKTLKTEKEAQDLSFSRVDLIESGFLEGFWAGKSDLKMPAIVAQTVDALSDQAQAYALLATGEHFLLPQEKEERLSFYKKELAEADRQTLRLIKDLLDQIPQYKPQTATSDAQH